ncbi:autotransporter strand-loop-strand O-heptosyltransferase [Pandoraea oxalativorans]|uniref:Autotransporter strand-loop-strand O-heptosyltransferase n=1 Tax=Pandoraea oxalativorans TaxID=573737 RepID=A0A192B161_9BURK|nr:autotransporter strand-loop-strand O-heptosyltransferase [Pandoraea oxalativorans]ANJ86801.1 autotransporter strand-loop-strand O-heptosyltransferase [Pandoraea oxalativorans]
MSSVDSAFRLCAASVSPGAEAGAPTPAPTSAPVAASAPVDASSSAPASPAAAPVLTSAGAPGQPPYPTAPTLPTLAGPKGTGIRFDFNDGCRILVPKGDWKVTLSDSHTGNTLFQTSMTEGCVMSAKKYFVPFEIDVSRQGKSVMHHRFDARDKAVLILFPVGTLGDLVGWFPYAVKFQEKHQCRLTVSMSALLIPLFQGAYPHIEFVTPEQVKVDQYYATYRIGLFFDDHEYAFQPSDFRQVGLHRTAGHILGVDPTEMPPLLSLPDETRPIPERYVCIAVQASTQCKYWNFPGGWKEIVQFLKDAGYRVICIDQKSTHGVGTTWNHIPWGCEDQTGDRPLAERARWLRHADFFVGLSSGLAWLAWATNTPVVMISGFTHETNEFETPYRIVNHHTCNSCWNDVRHRFDHFDFMWCPRHKGTARQFECTGLITPTYVKNVIRTIPGFREAPLTPPAGAGGADTAPHRARAAAHAPGERAVTPAG